MSATDRQADYIRSLLADRAPADNPTKSVAAILAEATGLPREQAITAFLAQIEDPGAASRTIDDLKGSGYVRLSAAPAPADGSTPAVVDPESVPEGIHYLRDGDDIVVYKVQRAVRGSGKKYAKVLRAERPDGHGGTIPPRWEYVGRGPMVSLSDATLLDYETAKEFGALYGVCGRCGRLLTDEGSIMLGVGPVCLGKAGWEGFVDPETLKAARKLSRDAKKKQAA